MALLTPAEIRKLPPDFRGRYKHKCDNCKRVIISSLIYGSVDGQEACTESCKNKLNKKAEEDNYTMPKDVKKKKHNEDEEEVEKTEAEESSESESSSESEEPKKGGKKIVKKGKEVPAKKRGRPAGKKKDDDDEDEKPVKKGKKAVKEDKKSKKKSKKDDDDEDEKPAKKKKTREVTVGNAKNPFRDGCHAFQAFELAKEGCTVKAMKKLCEKNSVDYNWTLARLKKGEKRSVEWKFTIDEDDMKVKLKK